MKKRVLLVEDHPATMEVMKQEFALLGYDVSVAGDGEQAVERAAAELPDLVIMDMLIPRLDGLSAVSLIRQNPRTQSIPVLAATARALPGDRDLLLGRGCNGYIAKPFSHRELDMAIKKILDEEANAAE